MSWLSVSMFLGVIVLTLMITYLSSLGSKSARGFYAAGGKISGSMNGLAIAGDFLSATTFLGISGLVFVVGFDAAIYILAPLVGFIITLTLIAERIRNLGQYTLADVMATRFPSPYVRSYAALSTLTISLLYLIGQMVGAGALLQILFGIPYNYSVAIIGTLMILYVSVGGMVATTWVQITKAIILIIGLLYLSISILGEFDFNIIKLFDAASANHVEGAGIFEANDLLTNKFDAISLGAAMTFGMVGLPHILIRFFTVPDVHAARKSVVVALGVISFVLLLVFVVVGYGGIALLHGETKYFTDSETLVGGSNMMIIHLSTLVGGEAFKGAISAVAFATILAVVAGLTVASSGAISHDIYATLIKKGKASEADEVRISRITTIYVGIISILLGIAFEGQNLAYLVSLAVTVSASTNFPVLLGVLYWKGLTVTGLLWGGGIGLVSSIALLFFGPAVWIDILGNDSAIFPYRYPALFSMGLAFITVFLVSKATPIADKAAHDRAFDDQYCRGLR